MAQRVRGGFTLFEVLAVVMIGAVLAAVSIPALGAMNTHRADAGVEEVRRLVRLTRAMAMATGEPTGVSVDLTAQSVAAVRIDAATGSEVGARGALGEARTAVRLAERFGTLRITGFVDGGGTSRASGTVWFRHDGVPIVRSGTTSTVASADAVVTLGTSGSVTVRALSGAIE